MPVPDDLDDVRAWLLHTPESVALRVVCSDRGQHEKHTLDRLGFDPSDADAPLRTVYPPTLTPVQIEVSWRGSARPWKPHGTYGFLCPTCGRERPIPEPKLRAVIAAGLDELDISRLA